MHLVFDLETGSTTHKGRPGSPWANKILAIGLKYSNKRIYSKTKQSFFNGYSEGEYLKWSDVFYLPRDYMPTGWLDGVTILIGHNIKFDLLHIWRNDELQDYFRKGGRIWDTQLVEYILSGQRYKYPALRDIAVKRYSCAERTKKIEESLKAGIMTQDMDIEDLLFDVKNDVLDTEAIALQQVKQAKEKGMYNLIISEMDALLATTEMEFNGLFTNKEIMNKNKLELQIEYENKAKKLIKLSERYWK